MKKIKSLSLFALLISFNILNADTISGLFESDTTLFYENSPYVIIENVLIGENATLTIEPGVSINIIAKLLIDGTIKAIGTPDDSIYFFNNSLIDCGELILREKATDSSCIEYCKFKRIFFDSKNASLEMSYSSFIDSSQFITDGRHEIRKAYFNNSELRIKGITDSAYAVILDSLLLIESNIRHEGGGGDSLVITNTTIDGSDWDGISCSTNFLKISGCNIKHSSDNGVDLSASECIIENSIFSFNKRSGIDISVSNSCIIKHNRFINNNRGIYIRNVLSDTLIITNNLFYSGVLYFSVLSYNLDEYVTIKYNDFIKCSNYYALYMGISNIDGLKEIVADSNYWGTTDEDMIDSLIYDFNDYFDRVKVIYKPYSTTPFTDTSTDVSFYIQKNKRNYPFIFLNTSGFNTIIKFPEHRSPNSIFIYSISGKLLNETHDIRKNRVILNNNGLSSGTYILQAQGVNFSYAQKFFLEK